MTNQNNQANPAPANKDADKSAPQQQQQSNSPAGKESDKKQQSQQDTAPTKAPGTTSSDAKDSAKQSE